MAIRSSSVAIRNRLLAALPPDVLSRLLPRLHPVSLSVRDTLFPPETAIEAVHFVETGWVSLVAALDDGAQAEVGLVGREGMVGLPLIIGVDTRSSASTAPATWRLTCRGLMPPDAKPRDVTS